jgi:predicted PurR-regulated permease PerM
VILLSVAGVGVLGWVVLGQVYSLAIELPQYQQNVTGKIDALHLNSTGKLSSTVAMLSSVGKQIASGGTAPTPILSVAPTRRSSRANAPSTVLENKDSKPAPPVAVRVEGPEESMLTMAGRTVTPLVHPLVTTFIVVIFLVFMLLGREDLRDRGLRLAGSGRMHVTTTAMEDASRRVSRYLQMQLVVNVSYGAVVGLLLWWIGVPNPALWGVLTCLLRFVPYIGILMAAAGPLLLATAVSPQWGELLWTVLMFVVLEIVAANFVEPMLYGASTGISAMAILIAAIFWTLLWGLPGLLLSTPLTVCLIVIGRQVPQLRYLEVLFGEETVLPPPERFYQRILASHTAAATTMLEEMLKTKSKDEVFDAVLIPTLSLLEEARHSEQITGTRAEEMLQGIEEIAEDVTSRRDVAASPEARLAKRMVCVPARDFADEVACQLALQVLSETASVRVVPADSSTAELLQLLDGVRADIFCVVGIPPHAIRHVCMRCHQIRTRFPDAVVVACVLSNECDLSSVRSRIPIEDAQHVVCTLQLLKEYLSSLLHPEAVMIDAPPEIKQDSETKEDINGTAEELHPDNLLDGPEDGIFERLATSLARSFDAPIALITAADGERYFWEAQCGLPEERPAATTEERDLSICSTIGFRDSMLIVPDTAEDELFAADSFLKANGIRFYAGTPLKRHDGGVIGSVCVLDTRPRQVTEHQKENLIFMADAVATAIELRGTATPSEVPLEHQEA